MSATTRLAMAAMAALALAGCSDDNDVNDPENVRPDFIKGAIASATYDGTTDDLLTAGLGKSGLAGASPTLSVQPTHAELRRLAIYNNYRALVNVAANGGYGTLYGPNVDAAGAVTSGEGRIAGEEHLAYADDGSGRENVTMMVQIPSTFSTSNPCIVTATSSGSRGVYGAIGTSGEWGLKRGCAVAYTDKGTGNGAQELNSMSVYLMQGRLANITTTGVAGAAQFYTATSGTDISPYTAGFPNRWAFKHAHSQLNPEKDWGRDTLRAIQFAFYLLNEKYGNERGGVKYRTIKPDNTLVIASSVSNGAGAAIAAAEQDTEGLIDGIAVAEPQIQMNAPAGVTIRRGANAVSAHSKVLYDYFTIANLYQPCASLATAAAGSPGAAFVAAASATNRCEALAARGLVNGTTTQERANDALARLLAAGWEAESTPFQASHYALATLSVTLTYANSYARANVRDNLCGYSFGATPVAGTPPVPNPVAAANLFGTGNGVPPTSGINIINNNSVGGAAVDAASVSPSTGKADLNVDGALCLRGLFTGTDAIATTVRTSIDAVKRTGNLRGKPAVIVHGRADTLIPVNHTSRPYFALNKTVDASSRLSYYEVTNAQHFDAFIDNAVLPGYDSRLVPLHRYFNQALDIVYNNLRNGAAIPPSQVVRTTPRGGTPGAAPAITATNVPAIAATPTAADTITFTNNVLTIPE